MNIVLISKRGTRVAGGTCHECHEKFLQLWRYAESESGGPVFICDHCKPEVFDRSFGKIDVCNSAYQGGRGDGNRR